MTEIRLYHLTRRTAMQALPELVSRAYGRGHKIVVRCADAADASRLDEHLWTFHAEAFLPHGTEAAGATDRQPIFLTERADNPAGADVLMMMPGASQDGLDAYALCCLLLDGHDEAQVTAARAAWKIWKDAGHALTYWQQTDQGKWEQK